MPSQWPVTLVGSRSSCSLTVLLKKATTRSWLSWTWDSTPLSQCCLRPCRQWTALSVAGNRTGAVQCLLRWPEGGFCFRGPIKRPLFFCQSGQWLSYIGESRDEPHVVLTQSQEAPQLLFVGCGQFLTASTFSGSVVTPSGDTCPKYRTYFRIVDTSHDSVSGGLLLISGTFRRLLICSWKVRPTMSSTYTRQAS
jgi:hypothetical protein